MNVQIPAINEQPEPAARCFGLNPNDAALFEDQAKALIHRAHRAERAAKTSISDEKKSVLMQEAVFERVTERWQTASEIAANFSDMSAHVASNYLRALRNKGLIERDGRAPMAYRRAGAVRT